MSAKAEWHRHPACGGCEETHELELRLAARLKRAQAEVRKLRRVAEALEPFARRCDDYERDADSCGRYPDASWLELEDGGDRGRLRVRDLRRAKAALEAVR